MSTIRFTNGFKAYQVKLSIGDDLKVVIRGMRHPKKMFNCRFIKVTRKGFNILNLDTDRTVLKHHVYAKNMANKEFPKDGPISGVFMIPEYISVDIKPKEEDKVS